MRKYLITGAVCFILGAIVVGGLVYQSGAKRARQLGGELDAAIAANRELTGQLEQRAALVNQLAKDNRRIAESNESSQRLIDATKIELESSKSSVAKIRAILELLRDAE